MTSKIQKKIEKNIQISNQSDFQQESSHHSGISHENSQCVKMEKIQRLKKRKKRVYSTKARGNWGDDEDLRFVIFMEQNREFFENKTLRRSNKIFKRMAKLVKTRCPEQCRSHHQKYEKKFHTFDSVINSIRQKINSSSQKMISQDYEKAQFESGSKSSTCIKNKKMIKLQKKNSQTLNIESQVKIKIEENFEKNYIQSTGYPSNYSTVFHNNQYKISLCMNNPCQIKIELNIFQ